MASRVTYQQFKEKITGFPGLIIAEFYSDSCVPCKKMSPVLAALEAQYEGAVSIIKVNAAYERELTEEYGIKSSPTFLFFRDGKLTERFSGVRKKEELAALIEANK